MEIKRFNKFESLKDTETILDTYSGQQMEVLLTRRLEFHEYKTSTMNEVKIDSVDLKVVFDRQDISLDFYFVVKAGEQLKEFRVYDNGHFDAKTVTADQIDSFVGYKGGIELTKY